MNLGLTEEVACERFALSPLQQLVCEGQVELPRAWFIIDCGDVSSAALNAALSDIVGAWDVLRLHYDGDQQWSERIQSSRLYELAAPLESAPLQTCLSQVLDQARAMFPRSGSLQAATTRWRGHCWLVASIQSASFDHISAGLLANELGLRLSPPRAAIDRTAPAPVQCPEISEWMTEACAAPACEDELRRLLRARTCEHFSLIEYQDPGPGSARCAVEVDVPAHLTQSVRTLLAESGSCQALWSAAFATALAPFCEADTLSVGWVHAGRDVAGLESCPGRLTQCFPLTFDAIGAAATLDTLFAQARAGQQVTRGWQLRFDVQQLWRALGGSDPLFTLLMSETHPDGPRLLRWADESMECPLQVTLTRSREESLVVAFDEARYDANAIQLVACRAVSLVEEWSLRQARGVTERARYAPAPGVRLPTPCPPVPRDREGFIAAFQLHCTRRGRSRALRDRHCALSYGELLLAVESVARHLLDCGVRSGDRVVLRLAQPHRQIIGLLACLRLGVAFVPADPAWPDDRVAWIASDCASPRILADSDEIWVRQHEGTTALPPLSRLSGVMTAYVVYTSGSTGRPKGVAVSHANMDSYLIGLERSVDLTEVRSMAGFGSFAADLTYTAIFTTLWLGGELHLFEPSELLDTPAVIERMSLARIDMLKTVPSLLPALLAADPTGSWLPRRYVMLGGEPLSESLLQNLARLAPTCQILNEYGPTEATVGVTMETVAFQASRLRGVSRSTLGRNLAEHVQVDVLDDDLLPVPTGARGELVIRGPSVSQGYLRNPRMTATRFVPDAYSSEPGARLYRSGDWARELPDGRIEFLGRRDGQIKLRGYRIELGEVENVLLSLDGVIEAAVVPELDGEGTARALRAAYSGEVPEETVRAHCARMLPEHAIPATIARVPALPRLASGKIDRPRIVTLHGSRAQAAETHERDPVAELIATALGALVDRATLAEDEDFFEAGGNSILVIRGAAAIQQRLGRPVPAHLLFSHRTPRALARALQSQASAVQKIPPTPDEHGAVPLTYAQERLWYASSLLAPGALNLGFILDIRGPLDSARLQQALQSVARRHDILRYRIDTVAGVPCATLHSGPFPLTLHAASSWEPSRVDTFVQQQSRSALDLRTDGPIRCDLLQIAPDHHRLLFVMHHLVTDAWSHSVLLSEVARQYNASSTDDQPPLPVQYADFARAERARCTPSFLAEGLERWRRYLADSESMDLRAGRRHGPATGSRRIRYRIPRKTLDAALEGARAARVSAHSALLGLFLILMRKISHSADLTLGVAKTERESPELQQLIGLFFQLVPFRSRPDPHWSVHQLWKNVQQGIEELWRINQTPFAAVADALPRGADPLQPWFNVVFAHRDQDAAREPRGLFGEARVEVSTPEIINGQYDLYFATDSTAEGLDCVAEFRTDALHPDCVLEWMRLFEKILSAAARPETRLCEIALGAGTRREPAPGGPRAALEVIREQTVLHPTRAAVYSGDGVMTYRELEQRVNAVAQALHSACLPSGACVAVCLERGPLLPACLLALLSASLVYVPIEPQLPALRRQALIRESGAAAIIASRALLPANRECFGSLPVILAEELAPQDRNALSAAPPAAEQPAYVMFTSGSTGQPKGVCIGARQLDHFLAAAAQRLQVAPEDTVLCMTSVGFDISLLELLLPLYCGASLRMVASDCWHQPGVLRAMLEQGVTVMQATPSVWSALMGDLHGLHLRRALVGGEPVAAEIGARLATIADEAWNLYGPTECTIWVSANRIDRNRPRTEDPLPIGTALSHVSLGVEDVDGHECPPAVPGELVISGPLVGLGYWRDAGRTAEKFRSDSRGTRAFRTADRVVPVRTGELLFLGRTGGFIKLHGHRIEPGDVEAALLADERIAQAVVLVTDEPEPSRQLVACVVAREPTVMTALDWRTSLRVHLQDRLPTHMIPSRFELLDSIPLTASGKIDRRACLTQALPAGTPVSLPVGKVQTALAAEFARILRQPAISPSTDFFAAGGNSLLAVELQRALNERFATKLGLREIFENPTLEKLAQRIESVGGGLDRAADHQPIAVSAASDAVLSPYQEGVWLTASARDTGATFHMSALLRIRGTLDVSRLRQAYARVADTHDQLRVCIDDTAGRLRQRVHEEIELDFRYQVLDERGRPDAATVRERVHAAICEPFDLHKAGYSRLLAWRLAEQEHLVAFVIHHLIGDEWSWRLLLSDLSRHYESATPERAQPSAPRLRYIDYAAWLERELSSRWLQDQLSFWRAQLADAAPLLELRHAKPRPAVRTFCGNSIAVELTRELSQRLAAVAAANRVSLFSVLVAAYAWTLYDMSGQSPIVIGTAVANRRRAELEEVVGNFVNLVPLVLRISSRTTLQQLLTQARDTVEAGLDHQELPFLHLARCLAGMPSASYAPLLQNVIVFHNTRKAELSGRLGQWEVQVEEPGYSYSEYELDLGLHWQDGIIAGYLRFNSSLYDAAEVSRVSQRFLQCCSGVCGEAHQPLSQLALACERTSRSSTTLIV